mmetsp:Transcript_25127/g.37179  ORF Transcript_25127/g.37179 Transcript_25127/m.37179 type:complete len:223 (-) Transcript_25127:51-719(-)
MQKLGLLGESSKGRTELERPQEVIGLLEGRSYSDKLMDEISTAIDSMGRESILNDGVLGDRNTTLIDLSKSTLVHELLNGGTGRDSISYIRLDKTKHADSSLVQSNKGSIVDLTKTEELHNLLGLGVDSDDTANTNDKSNLGLGRDVESSSGLGLTTVVDGLLLGGGVFGSVLGSVGHGELLGGGSGFLGGHGVSKCLGGDLGLGGLLLEYGFRGFHVGVGV